MATREIPLIEMRETLGSKCDVVPDITTQDSRESYEKDFLDPDMREDRFRVDRRKLEEMLHDADGETMEAEKFFQQVMEETDTVITWPTKLKVGAKSKKDPQVKIRGKPDSVRNAREQIMAVLDTKSNRVTLKMDVSYADHSHIIGKGGNNIKKVMQETGCHIHFPDSNRNNPTEKSNQVSIAGQPSGIEHARYRIRELLPLIFTFELPVTGVLQPFPDISSPTVQKIQQTHNITVQFRQRPRVYITSVIVRGCQNEAQKVKEGTILLMEHLAGSVGARIPVTMTMEVAPHHHPLVMGRASINVKLIMQKTATTVVFPDPNFNTEPLRKSTIVITGGIDNVYLARQQLMGCLPLVLMFDMKDKEVDTSLVSRLMEQLDVYISIKPKPKQPSRSVIIKGIERNAANLYEARRLLLGLDDEPPVEAKIPASYVLPNVPSIHSFHVANGTNGLNAINAVTLNGFGSLGQNVLTVNTSGSLYHSPLPSPELKSPRSLSPHGWNKSNYSGYFPFLMSRLPNLNVNNRLCDSLAADKLLSALNGLHLASNARKGSSVCSSTTSTLSSPNQSPRQGSPVESDLQSYSTEKDPSQTLPQSLAGSSINGLQAFLGGQSVHHHNESSSSTTTEAFGLASGAEVADKLAPGYELKYQHQFPLDYDRKKLLANKAMKQKPVGPESRIPTNSWSGYGFSKSMPESVIREKLWERSQLLHGSTTTARTLENVKEDVDKDPWKDSKRMCEQNCHPFQVDNISMPRSPKSKDSDLVELLSKLGLGKYTDLFQQQEIDLSTFLTLTDQDLKYLGITTFGARRKMLLAISDINKHQIFSVAPGAERKACSSLNSVLATTSSGSILTSSSFW